MRGVEPVTPAAGDLRGRTDELLGHQERERRVVQARFDPGTLGLTRNPAVSTQAEWSMCSTIVWPGARAASVATTCGRDSSMSLVLVLVPGMTGNNPKVTSATSTRTS